MIYDKKLIGYMETFNSFARKWDYVDPNLENLNTSYDNPSSLVSSSECWFEQKLGGNLDLWASQVSWFGLFWTVKRCLDQHLAGHLVMCVYYILNLLFHKSVLQL